MTTTELRRVLVRLLANPHLLKQLHGSLLGSCNSHRDVPLFLELWRQDQLKLEAMISSRRPLAEVELGFEDMRNGKGIRTVLDVA